MKTEIRSFAELPILKRNDEGQETRIIEGYAVVFDSRSEYLGFYETIYKGAITEDLIRTSDVVMCFNHDQEKILARSTNGEGTLHLTLDDHGLHFEFEVPNTTVGNDVLELVRRGDIKGCSFAFSIDPEDESSEHWERMEDGNMHRSVFHIAGLYDTSIVIHPAYPDTDVQARAKAEEQKIKENEARAAEEAEAARVGALNEKYDAMLAEVDTL